MPNVNIAVALPDGRQLNQTVNTTNGPATIDFVVTELALRQVSGSFVDSDGVSAGLAWQHVLQL